MLARIIHFFWPDLTESEQQKFSLLGFMSFLIIGSYWMLRLLKNIIIYKVAFPECLGWCAEQGRLMQPIAKTASLFIMLALVFIYSKLVDWFEKHTLFYILVSFYVILFSSITTVLALRHFYGEAFLGKNILAMVGWATFFIVESFGSLIVALFWSFTHSITSTDSAKRGYPLIAAMAQFGAIIGSIPLLFPQYFGDIWVLFFGVTLCVLGVIFVMHHFMRVVPHQAQIGNRKAHETEKEKESFLYGMFSGIWLLFSRPYLFAVLIVSTFYEIINQIIEFQMQSNAYIHPQFQSEIGFAYFQGIYGLCVNILSFLMALLGTGYLIKKYGLRFCLLLFPVCLGIAFTSLYLFFNFGSPTSSELLWATFGVMIIAKGLGYAINNPAKEIMYIPTSKDAKFKTKGWIDMFGSRAAKGTGSQVTNAFKHHIPDLMVFGTMFSLGITAVWIVAAFYVGTKNKKLIQDGKIIE